MTKSNQSSIKTHMALGLEISKKSLVWGCNFTNVPFTRLALFTWTMSPSWSTMFCIIYKPRERRIRRVMVRRAKSVLVPSTVSISRPPRQRIRGPHNEFPVPWWDCLAQTASGSRSVRTLESDRVVSQSNISKREKKNGFRVRELVFTEPVKSWGRHYNCKFKTPNQTYVLCWGKKRTLKKMGYNYRTYFCHPFPNEAAMIQRKLS